MGLALYNLNFIQGEDVNVTVYFEENGIRIPLDGYSAKLQIRRTANSSKVLKELSSPSSGITIDTSARELNFILASADSALLKYPKAVYDLKLTHTSPSMVVIGLYGDMNIRARVTR